MLIIGRDSLGLTGVLSRTLGRICPPLPERGPEVGEAIYWSCRGHAPPALVAVANPDLEFDETVSSSARSSRPATRRRLRATDTSGGPC